MMKRKWMGICGACIILLTIFTAVFYIASEADHDCTGKDCPICQVIHAAQGILAQTGKTIIQSPSAVQLPIFLFTICSVIIVLYQLFHQEHTLVTEKIRFNN